MASQMHVSADDALAGSYLDLLLADSDLAERSWTALTAMQESRGLTVNGRHLCRVLAPRFLTAQREATLRRSACIMAGVLERIGEVVLQNDSLLEAIGATEEECSLWRVDPGYPGFTLTSRLDAFFDGEAPRFVEYNAESPAGIGYCDEMTVGFEALPVMQIWESRHRVRGFACLPHLFDTLLRAYAAWGGRGKPRIAVIDWDDVITRRDFEICAAFFTSRGADTIVLDPRALRYSGGRMMAAGERIDLVYRRVLLHELLEKEAEVQPLLTAYRDGAVCMVNSPRSKLLHKKAILALLSARQIDLPLTEEESATIDDTIPWTRRVIAGRCTYQQDTIDLLPFVIAHRERLALKPNDDYGGRGVVLGWTVDQKEWEAAVEHATGSHFVVQERVPIPTAVFPIKEGRETVLKELYVDTDPLMFSGEMGGILTRISGSDLLNVTAGAGSSVPTYVVEG